MAPKLLFLNTGWMDFYQGLNNDTIIGGGKHVRRTGWGGEMYNFKAFNGYYYGYVQPKLDLKYNNRSVIKLEKLGARESSQHIKNVTVVWTATDPYAGGTYIVGWYKNATVYRYLQPAPAKSKRRHKGQPFGFFVKAAARNVKLLPADQRLMPIKRGMKGGMGQSNVWYGGEDLKFLGEVEDYINFGKFPSSKKKIRKGGSPRQPDPFKRLKVEKAAVACVQKHYTSLGYEVISVEKDNIGWDLTAISLKNKLKIEVKGLSGSLLTSELTPNEYECFNLKESSYRLCVVTNALKKKAILSIFSYSKERGTWCSEDGTTLKIKTVMSARVSV